MLSWGCILGVKYSCSFFISGGVIGVRFYFKGECFLMV